MTKLLQMKDGHGKKIGRILNTTDDGYAEVVFFYVAAPRFHVEEHYQVHRKRGVTEWPELPITQSEFDELLAQAAAFKLSAYSPTELVRLKEGLVAFYGQVNHHYLTYLARRINNALVEHDYDQVVYIIEYDNGFEWSDHHHEVRAVFANEALAAAEVNTLNNYVPDPQTMQEFYHYYYYAAPLR